MPCSSSFSFSSDAFKSWRVFSLSALISCTLRSMSCCSCIKSPKPCSASFLRSSALTTFSLAVFCLIYNACKASFSSSMLRRTLLRSTLIFSMAMVASSNFFFADFNFCSSSSSSLLRPKRLELLLKAPPLIAPPGTSSSPSNVTMRIL